MNRSMRGDASIRNILGRPGYMYWGTGGRHSGWESWGGGFFSIGSVDDGVEDIPPIVNWL